MAGYDSCPYCGREPQRNLTSNWFPLLRCRKCDALFCHDCERHGACPTCGSDDTQTSAHKVYAS